jgi:hypothetical protein
MLFEKFIGFADNLITLLMLIVGMAAYSLIRD